MAVSAAYLAKNPQVVSGDGHPYQPRLETHLEASGSFKAGELVSLASGTGRISALASDAVTVFGIVQEDAAGANDTELKVVPIYPGTLLRMRCTNNGTETTSASFIRGENYGLYVASNYHWADINDTTNELLQFVEDCLDPVGDATVWGIFKVIDTTVQKHVGGA